MHCPNLKRGRCTKGGKYVDKCLRWDCEMYAGGKKIRTLDKYRPENINRFFRVAR